MSSWTDPGATRGDLTIFHFALVSPMTPAFARLSLRPRAAVSQRHAGAFFAGYDAAIYRLAMLGREDLKSLVGHTDKALGDSEYNRKELEDPRVHEHRRLSDRDRYRRITERAPPSRSRRSAERRRLDSTSCSSAASSRTRRSRITSSWPSTTSATSTSSTDSCSSARRMRRRTTTRPSARCSSVTGCRRGDSSSRGRCRTRTWRRTTARPASTSRSRSTKGFACLCSKRWPRTCPCSPMRQRRCRIRLAARACSSRRKISNTRPSFLESSPTTTACGGRSLPASATRLADFGDDRIRKELERLTA